MVTNTENKLNVVPVVIGSSYNAYGVVRSFGEEGIQSILITTAERNFVRYSKYLERHVIMIDVNKDEELFISQLVALGQELAPRKGMFFPTHDEQLAAIAAHKEELLPYYELPFSDLEVCRQIMDKANFRQVCEAEGIPTIKERLVHTQEKALGCLQELRMPLIAKANIWNIDVVRSFGNKIAIFYDENTYREHIRCYYEALPNGELLVQEYIEDSDRDMPTVNCITNREGEMICVYVSEKIRQYPPQIGTSTAMRACDPEDPIFQPVIEYTRRMLKAVGFYGLSGTEFKYDPQENVYKIVETNARSEFCNYLQTLVGQNMAYQIYRYHLGQTVTVPYYPVLKSASAFVPFNDRFYFLHLNKYNYPNFVLSGTKRKASLTKPVTGYGLTPKDMSAYIMAYILSAISGVGAYIRIKHNIPNNARLLDYLLKKG